MRGSSSKGLSPASQISLWLNRLCLIGKWEMEFVWVCLGQKVSGPGEDDHYKYSVSATSQTRLNDEEEAPGLPGPPLHSLSFLSLLKNVTSSEAFPVERILFLFLLKYLSKTRSWG